MCILLHKIAIDNAVYNWVAVYKVNESTAGSKTRLQGPPNSWQHNFILKLNIFNFML